MNCILLAAGRSTRFEPLGDKNTFKFCGKTLIEHQIDLLNKAGVKHGTIVCQPENVEDIKQVVNKYNDVWECVLQPVARDMAEGIFAVEGKYKKEPILLVSTNDVLDIDAYNLLAEKYKLANADAYILTKEVKDYFPGGYVTYDSDLNIKSIIEKPEPGSEPSNMVTIVAQIFRQTEQLFTYLNKVKDDQGERHELALGLMLKDNLKIQAVPYDGFWQAIKYPWHILLALPHFLRSQEKFIAKDVHMAKTAVIDGLVVIESGVKIFEHAVIKGPAYIGHNAVVANNALVRDAHVGARSVVGYNTEIARSYVGEDVWTHSNYVGDSVICNNVSYGAGTLTGNLRFDEQPIKVMVKGERLSSGMNKLGVFVGENVRSGINVDIMPGVKIGRDAILGAGALVATDVPEGKFLVVKQSQTLLENKLKGNLKDRGEMMDKLGT